MRKRTRRKKKDKEIGFILYEGPSKIDGSPIVVIATIQTGNTKTGDMIQTWIIPADIDPLHAVQLNRNRGVCGDCPLQGIGNGIGEKTIGRVCYVNLGQAPKQVYESFTRGRYAPYSRDLHEHYFVGRKIRWGAYGDPAAMPIRIIAYFSSVCRKWTGYSHQLFTMRPTDAMRLAKYVMASCHTPAMHREANKRGWRTFTVISDKRFAEPEQLECLYYSQGLKCADCLLCNGNSGGGRNIYVIAHGKVGANLPILQGV